MREKIWSSHCESPRIHEHYEQTESALIARSAQSEDSHEIHKHHETISQTEREEHCLRRAMLLMAVLAGLAVTGVGQTFIVLENLPPYKLRLFLHIFGVLTVASVICLFTFTVLWLVRRCELGEQRERGRRLALRLLSARSEPGASVTINPATKRIGSESGVRNVPTF